MSSNTFSEKSHEYATARPQYPAELFGWLRQAAGAGSTVWDAATGNGQAAQGLAAHFAQVVATDISCEQIAAAKPAANIRYSVASAEQSGLADNSCNVVTVAQALHWFDYAKFWPEVRRVARSGGLFCAFGYAWMTATPTVDQELVLPFQELVSPFWAPNNRILWDGYQPADIQFPFEEVPAPDFAIGLVWSINSIIDYMLTWSAYKRSRQDEGVRRALSDLLEKAHARFDLSQQVSVNMPLKVRAGRIA